MGEGSVKLDKWGYEVRTSSQACISSINAFYVQVLSYGRHRSVILEAASHDKACVLANILAAHFLNSSYPSRAPPFLAAAKANLEQATRYEKLVFDAVSYLASKDRDDDVAVELHLKFWKLQLSEMGIFGIAKVLRYGRDRSVILEAAAHDKGCVLASILAAHFLNSSYPSRLLLFLRLLRPILWLM